MFLITTSIGRFAVPFSLAFPLSIDGDGGGKEAGGKEAGGAKASRARVSVVATPKEEGPTAAEDTGSKEVIVCGGAEGVIFAIGKGPLLPLIATFYIGRLTL